jgi:regulator of sirC expression with transglutaminase-like and TPR domain
MGKEEDAIVDHNRALELNPKLTNSFVNRGIAYLNLGMQE